MSAPTTGPGAPCAGCGATIPEIKPGKTRRTPRTARYCSRACERPASRRRYREANREKVAAIARRRWREANPKKPGPSLAERFFGKVDVRPGACWPWKASTQPSGYGQIRVAGKMALAHRVAYQLLVGPIPDGLHIDHLCRNRACVNPDHLEPVTLRENTARGAHVTAHALRTNHCIHGHEYTDENTYRSPNGGRACRTCRSIQHRTRRAALRDLEHRAGGAS